MIGKKLTDQEHAKVIMQIAHELNSAIQEASLAGIEVTLRSESVERVGAARYPMFAFDFKRLIKP